jgi:hypothetical protein
MTQAVVRGRELDGEQEFEEVAVVVAMPSIRPCTVTSLPPDTDGRVHDHGRGHMTSAI